MNLSDEHIFAVFNGGKGKTFSQHETGEPEYDVLSPIVSW
jgi:hypothetical protein